MQVSWEDIRQRVQSCTSCKLCETRTKAVLGEGKPDAALMFVGEGPGRDEDLQGRPFVGAAGRLLDRMLASICLDREDVYITNVVKCRPPGNRVPEPSEAEACLGYLRAQFVLIQPKIIVCLGATAARHLCGPDIRITRDRGVWHEKKGIWMLPTYHPAALLRDVSKKPDSYQDMQAVRVKLIELAIEAETRSENAE